MAAALTHRSSPVAPPLVAACLCIAAVCLARVATATRPEDAGIGYYAVQVGAFRELGNAQAMLARLYRVSQDARILETGGAATISYVVVGGRFSDRAAAVALAEDLGRHGFSTFVKRMTTEPNGDHPTSTSAASARAPATTPALPAANAPAATARDETERPVDRAVTEAPGPPARGEAPAVATASAPVGAPSVAAASRPVQPAQRRAARRLSAGNPPPGVSLGDEGAEVPEPSMELLQRLMDQPHRHDLVDPSR